MDKTRFDPILKRRRSKRLFKLLKNDKIKLDKNKLFYGTQVRHWVIGDPMYRDEHNDISLLQIISALHCFLMENKNLSPF